MLKGHLPRVIYHQVYYYTKIRLGNIHVRELDDNLVEGLGFGVWVWDLGFGVCGLRVHSFGLRVEG